MTAERLAADYGSGQTITMEKNPENWYRSNIYNSENTELNRKVLEMVAGAVRYSKSDIILSTLAVSVYIQ